MFIIKLNVLIKQKMTFGSFSEIESTSAPLSKEKTSPHKNELFFGLSVDLRNHVHLSVLPSVLPSRNIFKLIHPVFLKL